MIIKHATIYTPDQVIEDGMVVVGNGRITHAGSTTNNHSPDQIIDATGCFLVPGFIDLQINGAFGHDFTSNPDSIWQVAQQLPRHGVTSFLPTIITSPPETIRRAQQILHQPPNFQSPIANPLGLHIEGPFFNPKKKGAHNPSLIQEPSLEAIADWTHDQHVRLVTLAPELPNSLPVIKQLVSQGVVVSAGHSMASFEEAQAGFRAGIQYGTHLFNAMPPLHHRHPGLIAALLDDAQATVGIIADGTHVHPSLIKAAWQLKGAQRFNLVTDAMAALGMPPGQYPIGSHTVHVTEADARLADGTLAGSILSMDTALRNLITFTGCTLQEALPTLTTTPAKLLDMENEIGKIAHGFRADMVLLDKNLTVIKTIINGKMVGD